MLVRLAGIRVGWRVVVARACAVGAAFAFLALICVSAPGASRAQSQGYYRSAVSNCEKWPYFYASAATQELARDQTWVCIEGARTSFYADRGGSPDFSRELYLYVPVWAGGRADTVKNAFLIEMRPGIAYRYTRGSWLARAVESKAAAFQTLPPRSWAAAQRTPPFLPTWWSAEPGRDKMLTGLRQIQNFPYPLNPLPWNARILFFQGMSFRQHTDFVALLAGLDPSRDHFTASNALVVYQLPGDGADEAHMALVPLLPVSQVGGSFAAATRDPMVATFAMGDLGVMARLMAPFAAAYYAYQGSGIPEQNRQICAERRAQGVPASALPAFCPTS